MEREGCIANHTPLYAYKNVFKGNFTNSFTCNVSQLASSVRATTTYLAPTLGSNKNAHTTLIALLTNRPSLSLSMMSNCLARRRRPPRIDADIDPCWTKTHFLLLHLLLLLIFLRSLGTWFNSSFQHPSPDVSTFKNAVLHNRHDLVSVCLVPVGTTLTWSVRKQLI